MLPCGCRCGVGEGGLRRTDVQQRSCERKIVRVSSRPNVSVFSASQTWVLFPVQAEFLLVLPLSLCSLFISLPSSPWAPLGLSHPLPLPRLPSLWVSLAHMPAQPEVLEPVLQTAQ